MTSYEFNIVCDGKLCSATISSGPCNTTAEAYIKAVDEARSKGWLIRVNIRRSIYDPNDYLCEFCPVCKPSHYKVTII